MERHNCLMILLVMILGAYVLIFGAYFLIVPSIVKSMNGEEIERLGVTAIGYRVSIA